MSQRPNITWGFVLAGSLLLGHGCAREIKYPELGMKVASPIDIASTSDGGHFLVLNADLDQTYNTGSILILDSAGEKKAVTMTPRLGRSLTVSGSDLIATFDRPDFDGSPGKVILYDIAAPTSGAVQKASWDVDCSPVNAVMAAGSNYFAVSCLNGYLYAGELKSDRSQSTLTKIRDFNVTRRAMYIDPLRQVLLLFPTKFGDQTSSYDKVFEDSKTYADDGAVTVATNEIPDIWEQDKAGRNNFGQRETFMFAAINLATEAAAGWPYRDPSDKDGIAKGEFHWTYFSLRNFDGTPDPDSDAGVTNFDRKYYRTNFWEIKPDPRSADAFYISHRGVATRAPSSNNVIRVEIVGDLTSKTATTADLMSFERAYGFRGEVEAKDYPGDFEIMTVSGQDTIIVNHFRDISTWNINDVGFGLTARPLAGNLWRADLRDARNIRSFYQIAVGTNGRIATNSFYGNSVYLLDVTASAGIKEVRTPIE